MDNSTFIPEAQPTSNSLLSLPLSFSKTLTKVFSFFCDSIGPLFLIYASVQGLITLSVLGVIYYFAKTYNLEDFIKSPEKIQALSTQLKLYFATHLSELISVGIFAAVASIIVGIFLTNAIQLYILHKSSQGTANLGEVFSLAFRRIPKIVAVSFLLFICFFAVMLVLLMGFSLLAMVQNIFLVSPIFGFLLGFIPATCAILSIIYVAVRLSFVNWFILSDNCDIITAFQSSWNITHKKVLLVIGYSFVLSILLAIGNGLLQQMSRTVFLLQPFSSSDITLSSFLVPFAIILLVGLVYGFIQTSILTILNGSIYISLRAKYQNTVQKNSTESVITP